MLVDYNLIFVLSTYSFRAFVALFWGVFLLIYRNRSHQNTPLSIIFILIGLLYLRNSFFRVPSIEPCDVYNVTSYLILIFIAPFTIFYADFSVRKKNSFKHQSTHFIPFVLMFITWVVIRNLPVKHIPFCFSIEDIYGNWGDYPVYVWYFFLLQVIFIGQVVTYFSMALTRFVRLRRQYQRNRYPVRVLDRLIAMDYLFLVYPLLCVFFMSYNNNVLLGTMHNIVVAIEISAIAILSLRLRLPIRRDFPVLIDNQYSGQSCCPEAADICRENPLCKQPIKLDIDLQRLFNEKEIYRLSQLTLQDVADELNSNRTYVSESIKRCYGCNFTQLLKQCRINAVKELLINTDKDIQTIMDETGFNARSSFYNAFKEFVSEEVSPTEWRKKNL